MTNSAEFLGGEEAAENVQGTDQAPAVQQAEVTAQQQDDTLFNGMVGEGKKFSDPEALAKAKAESDNHIVTIEEENANLRKKLEASSNNYQAILDKIEAKENNNVSANTKDALEDSSTPEDEIDLDEWFENKLTQRQQKEIEKANMAQARDLMIQTYGNLETAKRVKDEFLAAKPYMESAINDLIVNNPEQMLNEIMAFKAPQDVGDLAVNPVSTVPGVHVGSSDRYITYKEATEVFQKDKIKYASPEFEKLIRDSEAYYKSKGVDYYNV